RNLAAEYIQYLRVEKGLAANSLESYQRDLGKLKAWADKNGLELLTLTRQELREWLIDLGQTKLSENSKPRMISAMRGFYKFLMIDGHIRTNPSDNLDSPQKGFYLPKFLNQSEIETLLAQPDVSTETG